MKQEIMRKIERMSISKKRKILLQLANRQKNEKLKNDIEELNAEEVDKCFMELLNNYLEKGSVKDV